MRATLNDVFDIALLTAGLSMLVQPCVSLVYSCDLFRRESPVPHFTYKMYKIVICKVSKSLVLFLP